jgi:hypothetical protein
VFLPRADSYRSCLDIVFVFVKPAWPRYLIQLQVVSLSQQALQCYISGCDARKRVCKLIVIVRPMRCWLGFTEATSNAGAVAEAWPLATGLDSAKMSTDRARMASSIFAGR